MISCVEKEHVLDITPEWVIQIFREYLFHQVEYVVSSLLSLPFLKRDILSLLQTQTL